MQISTCSKRTIIEPCGLKNFEFQIDPYIGCEHLCYYCYALNDAETDWTKEIRIHENIIEQLSKELDDITPQTIYLGYKSDPYQPYEAEYRQTRKVLELLLERGFSASILTKSDLILRDIDILSKMKSASVSTSVAFNDETTRKLFEAKIVETDKRINALKQIKEAGIKTSALVCPIIPYITDPMPLIDQLAPITEQVWIYGISMLDHSDPNWQNYDSILDRSYPELKEQIVEVIFDREHSYWSELREQLNDIKTARGLNLNIHV